MKSGLRRTTLASLLGGLALLAYGQASHAGDALDTCQGGYRILLMTPAECQAYLRELRTAQARGNYAAMLDLQEWHTQLLYERSQACPCRAQSAEHRPARAPGASRFALSGQH